MSTQPEPHILIVDDQRDAARTLRRALEQAAGGYRVVDVPSGEEALLELRRVAFDLLIVDYRLPGMTGAELLARVQSTQPELPGLVISDLPLDDVMAAMGDLNVVWFFQRPVDTAEVANAVNQIFYGEDTPAPEAQPEEAAPAPDHAPAAGSLDAAAGMLSALQVDLGALGIALIHHDGRVLATGSRLEAAPDLDALAALLARSFAPQAELAVHLGGEARAFHYYEGSRVDVYALAAGPDTLLAVLFPAGSTRQMGPVLRYGRSAALRVAELLGTPPHSQEPAGPAAQSAEYPVEVGARVEAEPPVTPEPREASPPPRRIDTDTLMNLTPLEGEENAGELDLDFDSLAEELRDGEPGDLDAFWEEAAALHTRVSEDALSFDEAIELGLFPDEEDEEIDT